MVLNDSDGLSQRVHDYILGLDSNEVLKLFRKHIIFCTNQNLACEKPTLRKEAELAKSAPTLKHGLSSRRRTPAYDKTYDPMYLYVDTFVYDSDMEYTFAIDLIQRKISVFMDSESEYIDGDDEDAIANAIIRRFWFLRDPTNSCGAPLGKYEKNAIPKPKNR